MRTLHMANYYPPPPRGEPAPVRVDIEIDSEADRSHSIPQWAYSVTVTFVGGMFRAHGGTVEALDEAHATLRVYAEAVDTLAELLAEYVTKGKL